MSGHILYLLRHGATPGTGLNGHNDIDVTPEGIAACVEQAEAISPARLISSDLRRATKCADAIGRAKHIPVHHDPRWRELNFGDWDGRDIAAIGWETAQPFWDDPEANPPPGGERWSQLVARVSAALADVDGDTLVVTHGGAMKAALHILCGFDQKQLWAFDLPFAAMLALRVWPGEKPSGQIVGLWP